MVSYNKNYVISSDRPSRNGVHNQESIRMSADPPPGLGGGGGGSRNRTVAFEDFNEV